MHVLMRCESGWKERLASSSAAAVVVKVVSRRVLQS
jgi:hypothetical protein